MYPRPQDYTPPRGDQFVPKHAHLLNTVFVGIFATAAAGVVAWLFALGGVDTIKDSVDRAQFSQSPPWLTLGSPHQDVADSAVLNLGDLPPGWVLAKDNDDDDVDVDHEVSEPCKQFEGQEAFAGSQASSESARMDGPEKQSVGSAAYVFAGPDEAEGSLDQQRQALSSCGSDLAAVLEGAARQGLKKAGASPDQVQVQSALENLGSPNVGESGLMFRVRITVTGPGGSMELAMDFITFRHGRMLGSLSYMTVRGLRPEEEQRLAQIAAAKLQAANTSLPEA
jgi:hypothetical protein